MTENKKIKSQMFTPFEIVQTLTKKTFKDPYHIRYNKQLLYVLLRGHD
jgi:hypothetical protein